jgi:ribosomal protein S18 acetylase RimI-like enzyme
MGMPGSSHGIINRRSSSVFRAMLTIRAYQPSDWTSVWPILHAAIATGDTFAWAPESDEAEIHTAWIEEPEATFVACADDGSILGCYFIKPNQPGLGAHVCNAGYCTALAARGQGIAAQMCTHSLEEAKSRGFRAMQFNFVIATNAPAVHLWQKLGFDIVGRLSGAYRHAQLGFVDALVMYKHLFEQDTA